MNNNTNKKILTYKEFSRENLFNLILDEYAPNIQVQDIDNPKKDITKDIFSPLRSEIRYELEKRTFILFLFNPVLESIYALRKSSLFDYITGLHLYISSNPNFNYTCGLFKEKITSFDKLIGNWSLFLDSVIADIITLPVIAWKQTLYLEIEDLIRFYLNEKGIIRITINMANFNNFFKGMSSSYNFGIFLYNKDNGNEQLLISGQGNGEGKESGLYKEFTRINELVTNIKEEQNYYIKNTHEHEFA